MNKIEKEVSKRWNRLSDKEKDIIDAKDFYLKIKSEIENETINEELDELVWRDYDQEELDKIVDNTKDKW